MSHDLRPEVRHHTNGLLSGRRATPEELDAVISGRVNDLPITRTRTTVASVWTCDSFKARLRFLWSGRLTVTVLGQTTPPLAVTIGDPLE